MPGIGSRGTWQTRRGRSGLGNPPKPAEQRIADVKPGFSCDYRSDAYNPVSICGSGTKRTHDNG